jgi:hypothetical protein
LTLKYYTHLLRASPQANIYPPPPHSWHLEYECELVIISDDEFGAVSGTAGDMSTEFLTVGVTVTVTIVSWGGAEVIGLRFGM